MTMIFNIIRVSMNPQSQGDLTMTKQSFLEHCINICGASPVYRFDVHFCPTSLKFDLLKHHTYFDDLRSI